VGTRNAWILPSLVLVLVIPVWPACVAEPHLSAGKPDRIDVLYMSRSDDWVGEDGYRRDILLRADPSIDVVGVETVGAWSIWYGIIEPQQVNRKMRIYMPRTFEEMVSKYDLVILSNVAYAHPLESAVRLDPKWLSWFVSGVQEKGMCLAMWGGDSSWGGHGEQNNPSWGDTVVDTILPFESLWGYNPDIYMGLPLRPTFSEVCPLRRLPWKTSPPIGLLNKVRPKPGATLVAEAVSGNTRYPWIAYWWSGKGKVEGETQVFYSLGCGGRMQTEWEWWQDFLIYLAYFAVDKPIPEDIYQAHRLRDEINTYVSKVSMLVSLLEFVDKFGANTNKLYKDLADLNALEKVAEDRFRDGQYAEASRVFEQVHAAWADLNAKAMKVKRSALLWVYAIEYLVLTGSALVFGTTTWALMVRKKLYRTVGTTKFA